MHTADLTPHQPVILEEVLHYLAPRQGDTYLDLTAGYGGHATEVLARTKNAPAVLVDRDQEAISHLKSSIRSATVQLKHQDYLSASRDLAGQGQQFDLILADVGVSSPHLNKASRGFSLQQTGPLDMRMDNRQTLTAAEIVNTASQAELVDLFKRYGEEPRAALIAQKVVQARPFQTTVQLAQVIEQAIPRRGKIHPATQVFQALRIAVNDELEQLQQSIPIWIELLSPGGRLVVICFHSLEDRIVKRALADVSGGYDATLQLLTKKPVTASQPEIVLNPRARSAKLRAAVKIKT